MNWVKLDDDYDEEMEHLSDRAYRLATNLIIVSRRRHLAGRFSARAMAEAMHRHRAGERHLSELLSDEEGGPFLVKIDGKSDGKTAKYESFFEIRSYERYQPLTSKERTRKYREKKATQDVCDVTVMSPAASLNGHRDTSTRARPRAGYPEPVPSTTASPSGAAVGDAASGAAPAAVEVIDEPLGVQQLVAAYHDAVVEYGAKVNRQLLPRIGQAVRQLLDEGHDDGVVRTALRELARRNESPSKLAWIVGDVERAVAGTPMGRVMPPAIRAPAPTERVEPNANQHAATVRTQTLALLDAGDEVDPNGWRVEDRPAVEAAIAEWNQRRGGSLFGAASA